MTKYILFASFMVLLFSGTDCRKNPIMPPDNTPDTTSHNWMFQTFVLGVGNSSMLNDVAIINDTLVYAVGEIYLKDSTGQLDPNAYNFARWDGKKWDLMRIWFYTVCGQQSRTSYPASAIIAFSGSDVWIAMDGDQIARWNGTSQTSTTCLPVSFSVKKIWGENSNSIYAVGDGGNILHYADDTWTKFSSGTTNQLWDVWGVFNPSTNREEIYCAALDPNLQHNTILRITDQTTIERLQWDSTISVGSVWTKDGSLLYACGEKLYRNKSGTWVEDTITTDGYFFAGIVRGVADNDLFVVGFNSVAHYNGKSWKVYPELALGADYYRVAMTKSTVVIVGWSEKGAIAIIGNR